MKTISEALDTLFEPAKTHGDWAGNTAVLGADQRGVTFLELQKSIQSSAQALAQIGVSKNDKVIISSPNSPEYLAVLLAIWKLGAVAIPVDFRLTLEEAANVINATQPKAFLGHAQNCQALAKAKDKIRNPELPTADLSGLGQKGNAANEDLAGGHEADTAAFVILTSGTTGVPKGALHNLQNLMANLNELGEIASIKPGMNVLLPLPLSHIFGLEVGLIGLLHGACVSLAFTPDDFFKALKTKQFDIIAGVPALYSAILSLPQDGFDFTKSKILLSGGAALPQSLSEEFRKRFGVRLNNGYGSTEMKIIALNMEGPDLSVGKIVPSAEVKIMNSNHEVLPDGEVGEICIEGKTLMDGYFHQPEETELVMHHGHYHTGDLGYLKDGYLFISGRDKELINVAGNKVFPSEVEDVLRQHRNVKEVAVLGVPHSRLGQLVKAVIVIKDPEMSKKLEESDESKKEVRQELLNSFKEFCKEHLKKELRPLEWEFRSSQEALPKTASGKIDKKQLQTTSA